MKASIWRRIQNKRDGYERRFYPQLRIMLNREFRNLAAQIDVTNYNGDSIYFHLSEEPIKRKLIDLYRVVGSAFARDVYKGLKAESIDMVFKEEDGLEDVWLQQMENYVKTQGAGKITSIALQNRDMAKGIIRSVLAMSTEEGWGADEIARQIKKALLKDGVEMNRWRALRIARTEIMTASNQGSYVGAESLNMPLMKYWIPTYDSRTRDTHAVMESQNPKELNEPFDVGGWPAQMPGDASLPADEVINCRCAIAYGVKNM